MARSAAILSLHFSPAHASHIVAMAYLLRAIGLEVTLVLQEQYLSFADFTLFGLRICPAEQLTEDAYFDVAVFYNAAVDNPAVAARLSSHGTAVVYLFHEPDSVLNHFSEGIPEIFRLVAARYCSIAMLRRCSAVIVPSACARSLYQRYFQKYNRHVHTMPLLLDDEIAADRLTNGNGSRPYFAFIGNALRAHDFEAFIAFAKHAIRNGSSIPFLVATKTDLGALLGKDLELSRYLKEGRIEVHHGQAIPMAGINEYHLRSFCVWNVYKCSTQSGVLARAFMAGSPVLANRIGSFAEYIQQGVNGEFVDSTEPAALLQVVEGIRTRTGAYVDGCRRTFLNTFYYKANESRFAAILESAAGQNLR